MQLSGKPLMNSMKLVIPLHLTSWKKTPNDAVTPQRQSQFTPKMKANAVPRLLSSLVWIDQYNECSGMTSFIESMKFCIPSSPCLCNPVAMNVKQTCLVWPASPSDLHRSVIMMSSCLNLSACVAVRCSYWSSVACCCCFCCRLLWSLVAHYLEGFFIFESSVHSGGKSFRTPIEFCPLNPI